MEKKKALKYYIPCIITTVVMVCLSVYYYSGYQEYFIMPLYEYLYPQEVRFCLICTILMIIITAIWAAFFIAGAVKKQYKKYKVVQIIICVLLAVFLIASHIMIADYQFKRSEHREDGIPQNLQFVQLDDLFEMQDETVLETFTSYFDTGGPVKENYMVTQTCVDYTVDKKCVAFSNTDIQKNYYYEIKELRGIAVNELNSSQLSILEASEGYYLINNDSYNDIVIVFVKGDRVYQISVHGMNTPVDALFAVISDSLSTQKQA